MYITNNYELELRNKIPIYIFLNRWLITSSYFIIEARFIIREVMKNPDIIIKIIYINYFQSINESYKTHSKHEFLHLITCKRSLTL